MRHYNWYHAPVFAFFSRSFYRDVGLYWKGTGFAYLFLLLAVCSIPDFIRYHYAVSDYVDNKAPALLSQIPPITITKGEASADVAQPHIIIDPDTQKPLAIIDTTGKTTSLEGNEAVALLTKTEVIYKKNGVETRTFSFKKVDHFTLDKQRVSGWFRLLRNYSAVVLFPFAVVWSFFFRVIQALIFGVIGLWFARWRELNLSYQALLRLCVMSFSPAIIVSAVFGAAGIKFPLDGFLYSLATVIYLFLGVKAASCEKDDHSAGDDSLIVQP